MDQKTPKTASDLYSLLGEFTVEFERVCLFMREAINYWSLLSGNKNEMYVKTLTTGMSAKSLLVAFRSIAVSVRELSMDEQKILSNIYKQIDALIQNGTMCFMVPGLALRPWKNFAKWFQ